MSPVTGGEKASVGGANQVTPPPSTAVSPPRKDSEVAMLPPPASSIGDIVHCMQLAVHFDIKCSATRDEGYLMKKKGG